MQDFNRCVNSSRPNLHSEHHLKETRRQIETRLRSYFRPMRNERKEIQRLARCDDWSELGRFLDSLEKTSVHTGCQVSPYFSERSALFESWRQVQIQQYFGSFLTWQQARISLAKQASQKLEPGDRPLAEEIRATLGAEFFETAPARTKKTLTSRLLTQLQPDAHPTSKSYNTKAVLTGRENPGWRGELPLRDRDVLLLGPGQLDLRILAERKDNRGLVLAAPKLMLERKSLAERLESVDVRIGYYNLASCRGRRGEIVEALANGVLARVKDRQSRRDLVREAAPGLRRKIGVSADPSANMFGDYGPQMAAIILYDLLRNGANRVRVSGIDFYAKGLRQSYAADYEAPQDRGDDVVRSLRLHEIFANRAFAKRLWSRGVISGDKVFEKVMTMDDLQFAQKLDEGF